MRNVYEVTLRIFATEMEPTETQTEDDRIIETLIDYLPRLSDLGNGPALDEQTLRSHGEMSIEDTRGTAYGDHLQTLSALLDVLADDLQTFGNVQQTTKDSFDYEVPECDFLIEADPALHWSEDLLTPPIGEADPDKEYEQAFVNHRIVDLRGSARLFEMHVDYYTTGEVHFGLSVTPGYEAESARSGGDRLTTRHIAMDQLDTFDVDATIDTLRDMQPFVLSRVNELAGEQGVKLAHARAKALSECGLSNKEIADRMGVSEGTVRGYKSKFMGETRQAERRLISNLPVAKEILAEHAFDITHHLGERWYVCRTQGHSAYDQNNPYSVITVTEDQDSLGADLSIKTENHPSLGDLINAVYADATFAVEDRAEDVRDALQKIPHPMRKDAGFETLPRPRSRLDARVP